VPFIRGLENPGNARHNKLNSSFLASSKIVYKYISREFHDVLRTIRAIYYAILRGHRKWDG